MSSSDLYVFDDPYGRHSSSDMISSEAHLGFYPDSPIDIFQAISETQNYQNPVDESHSFEQFSPTILSSSPPSQQLENLSILQTTQFQCLPNASDLVSGLVNLPGLEVKSEEYQMGFESSFSQPFVPHSYSGGDENVAKFLQRSFSSNSFEGKPGFLFQPRFDTLVESPNYQNQALSSPENNFFSGQMRRVYSTGDLQNEKAAHTTQRSFSSPSAAENSFMEEPNFKVGRYSAEERKERISKYRSKRTQRNFNKTIKYACRKTLADNRPRIRGRFARNDESGEIPKAASSASIEDEDDLRVEGLHEENGTVRMGQFVNSTYGVNQFQYYGF